MPTIEEMAAWNSDEIQDQIQSALPAGWAVEYGATALVFICEVKDESGATVRQCAQPDPRVAMLDLYGWLLTRSGKPRSVWWTRRNDPMARPIHGNSAAPSVPDPAHLDPTAIRDLLSKKTKL